ncbi:MAG: Uma2 family endonuclease [Geminicoccaceae bacterium]|nr:Uma2 family endonuclease [Geminicoccaceae bacterium]
MSSASFPDLSSPEAFLSWVARQPVRFELVCGRLALMPPPDERQVAIAVNAFTALHERLRGSPWRAFASDLMVELEASTRLFPDVTVAPAHTRGWTDRPRLIVEVVGGAAREFDLAIKRARYLAKAELAQLLFVDAERIWAQLWTIGQPEPVARTFTDLSAVLPLSALGVDLPLVELYEELGPEPAG